MMPDPDSPTKFLAYLKSQIYLARPNKYRETMVVMDLGWVDLTSEYSTILLGSS